MSFVSDLPRSIARYVIGLWRRRWLIMTMAWIMALAGWVLITILPDYYQSRGEIYLNTDVAYDTDVGVRPDYEERVRVASQALLTRDNLEKVIYDTGLNAEIFNEVELQRKIESLSRTIGLESPQDRYFRIIYADKDPVMAQKVVQSVLDLFQEKDVASALEDFDARTKGVKAQIGRLDETINSKKAQINEFTKANSAEIVSSDRAPLLLEQKRSERRQLEAALLSATTRIGSVRTALAGTPRTTSGSQLDAAKIELAQLQSQFNENYPDIQVLKSRIRELETNEAALPSNPEYKRLRTEVITIRDNITVMTAQIASIDKEIDRVLTLQALSPEVVLELSEMERELKALDTRRLRLRNSLANAELVAEQGAGAGGIRYIVQESPKIAAEPSSPKRGLMSLGVLVLAPGIALGLAFLMTQLDRTYTQSADLEDALGLPVLGAVSPSLTPADKRKRAVERLGFWGLIAGFVAIAAILFYFHEIYIPDGGALLSPSTLSGQLQEVGGMS